jgi:hypothetical protein
MRHDAEHTKDSGPRRADRPSRAAPMIAALIASGLLVAACGGGSGGPGVAGAGSATTPAKSSSSGAKNASPLAFSRCMRAHGVPDFPDPDSQGQIQIQAGPGGDLGPDSPRFKAAQQACKSLEPRPSAADQRQDYAKALRFAQCVRAHGVPNFPDPDPGSNGFEGSSRKGSGGTGLQFDPRSPQFKTAIRSCRHLLPGGAISTQSRGGGS